MTAPQSHHDTYVYHDTAKAGFFTRMLWYSSGADAQLLARCPYSDRVKYQGMGGVVLATAVLAFLSGSYAFYVVFGPKAATALADQPFDPVSVAISVGFGTLWAAVIFNIDRFIVASTGKGDGTDQITLRELVNSLPRLAMATIIGICLSAPLEIRILKTEIDTELASRQKAERMRLDSATDKLVEKQKADLTAKVESANGTMARGSGKIEQERVDHENLKEKRRQEILVQRHALELEAEGASGSGKAGRGPAWQDKDENLKRMELELKEWDDQWQKSHSIARGNQTSAEKPIQGDLDRWKKELDGLDSAIKREKEDNRKGAANMDGLMMRIHISHEIGGAVPWLIMALLLAIEICPIFFKMMLATGAYDYLVENQKKLAAARYGIEPAGERLGADGKLVQLAERYHAAETVMHHERGRLESEAVLTAAAQHAHRARVMTDIAARPEDFIIPEKQP